MFGDTRFWLWSNGVRNDVLLGNRGTAKALNNHGQVVGAFLTGEDYRDDWVITIPVYHAFVWNPGSRSLRDLGTFGGWNSAATWINDQGVIGGAADVWDDRLPFITQRGLKRSLQSLISNPTGWKLALETHYVAADARIWGLGTFGSKDHIYEMTPETNGMYRIRSRGVIEGIRAQVFAFNEYGQAVGIVSRDEDRVGAFFWDGTTTILLGDLGHPGSYAYAINNLGQVVGMSYNAAVAYNAFLWENGVLVNLNDLISPDSGVLLTEAAAVNDAGSIVCIYRDAATGFYGVCLLAPVSPVPLEFSHHELNPDGLHLEVQGGAGKSLVVEYTSDFVEWATLAASTNLIGRRNFTDPNTTNATFRAYRARLLVP